MWEMRDKKAIRYIAKWQKKGSLISNYFKCQWIRVSIQKADTGRILKNNLLYAIYERPALDPKIQII